MTWRLRTIHHDRAEQLDDGEDEGAIGDRAEMVAADADEGLNDGIETDAGLLVIGL